MEPEQQSGSPPSPSSFITSIFRQLLAATPPALSTSPRASCADRAVNPLKSLPPQTLSEVKPLLLTLHCLFPSEFLLALDILDRRLIRNYVLSNIPIIENVTRGTLFVLSSSMIPATVQVAIPVPESKVDTRMSSAPDDPADLLYLPAKYYQVHLDSWHCTCPAFAVASLSSSDTSTSGTAHNDTEEPLTRANDAVSTGWRFGGTLTRGSDIEDGHLNPAICKHLLACILGTQCPELFGHGIERVSVTQAEMAALYAG